MRASRILTALCILAGIALLTQSCNLPFGGAESAVTYNVSPSGNEVKHPDGVRIIVPQGSLKNDAKLSVATSAETPPVLEGSTPLGKAYEISLSAGAELLFPLEVYLPLERKPGALDSQYTAMRWDNNHWTRLQGQVEGSLYHFATEHNTLYRLFYWEASEYPVEFFNESMTKVHIRPWRYETFHKYGGIGGTLVDGRYPDGTSRGWAYLPPGEYSQWCVDWSEFTKPVWDIYGGGYWTEFIGNFHFFFNQTVLLNRYSEIEMSKPNTPEVRFTIGAAMPGLCGQSPDVGRVNTNNPRREQPMPWTTLEPTRTANPALTNTPLRTSTLALTSTPVRTATAQPTNTLVRTATSSLNFANYIVSSKHIDRQEPLVITLAHDQDNVVLRGPITVNYVYYHRPSASQPVIIDPPIKIVIKSGENRLFELDDLYGLNDIYLYLVSAP